MCIGGSRPSPSPPPPPPPLPPPLPPPEPEKKPPKIGSSSATKAKTNSTRRSLKIRRHPEGALNTGSAAGVGLNTGSG